MKANKVIVTINFDLVCTTEQSISDSINHIDNEESDDIDDDEYTISIAEDEDNDDMG
jgi:hypothetical protein